MLDQKEWSPMDPPSSYEPPALETGSYDKMHPFLQKFMNDHREFEEKLGIFEKALVSIQKEGLSKEVHQDLRNFFYFFDHEFLNHGQQEERTFFPVLHRRLVEKGECGQGKEPTTAIHIFEADHVKMLQMGAVIFNFFGVSSRLPHPPSRLILLDIAIEQGKVLIELIRLHIFREDHIIFPLANKYIEPHEFEKFSFV